MRRIQCVLPLLLTLGLVGAGCDANPTKDKSMASVTSAAAVDSAAGKAGAPYAFSNSGSKVEFVGAKITAQHQGSFGKFSGTVRVPGTELTAGVVTVDIEMDSLVADSDKLTGHLKTPDFFDVAHYPKATFVSTAIKAGGDKGATHTVTGNLELHGVTKSITFPANVKLDGDTVTVGAEFGINRKDFNITYAGKADDLIKDEVLIKLTIVAKKAE